MGVSILTLAAIGMLAIFVFRLGPDREITSNQQAKWLLYPVLILTGLYAAFYLFFGIGEALSGDLSGLMHLAPAIMVIVLIFLAWRRPMEGGVVLVVLGLLASLYYATATMQGGRSFQWTSLIGGGPYLIIGLLFLGAAALARRK